MVCLIMSEANKRKKDPENIRQALLDCAAHFAFEEGFAAISIQKVASMAGVSKGGLFHHFPSKQHLIDALHEHLMMQFEAEVNVSLESDKEYGAFTRAYISAMLNDFKKRPKPNVAILSMMMDADMCQKWTNWIEGRLREHKKTDDGSWLEMIRFAADGIWLSYISGALVEPEKMGRKLIALTRQEQKI